MCIRDFEIIRGGLLGAVLMLSVEAKCQQIYEERFDVDTFSNSIYYKPYTKQFDSNFFLPDSIFAYGQKMPVKCIDLGAFTGRKEIQSIRLPEHLEEIGFEAFANCTNLRSLYLPSEVRVIDNSSFVNVNLLKVEVATENKHFDSRDNCNAIINSLTNTIVVGTASSIIPRSVTAIGENAFSGRTMLKNIQLSSAIEKIDDYAFRGCTSLNNVKIDNSDGVRTSGLRKIGALAFAGCKELEEIVLPPTLKTISTGAFYGCKKLRSIVIPSSVDSIGGSLFDNCHDLESIVVESGNSNYDSRNNCNAIIESKSNKLIAGCKNSKVPKSVRIIGRGAFAGQDGIKHMVLPDGIVEIEEGAFNACKNLESIVLPESIRELGDYFGGCNKLKRIIVHSKTPPNHAFDQSMDYQNITLCVPKGYVKRYRESGWDMFKNICEIER